MPGTTKELKVTNDLSQPAEVLASTIQALANGLDKLKASGVSNRAICVLLNDLTGVPKSHINTILNAGPELRRAFLR